MAIKVTGQPLSSASSPFPDAFFAQRRCSWQHKCERPSTSRIPNNQQNVLGPRLTLSLGTCGYDIP